VADSLSEFFGQFEAGRGRSGPRATRPRVGAGARPTGRTGDGESIPGPDGAVLVRENHFSMNIVSGKR
jgi:hypothetical protein